MRRSAAAIKQSTLMTVDQWAALDEDINGELVDGVLEEEEMASLLS